MPSLTLRPSVRTLLVVVIFLMLIPTAAAAPAPAAPTRPVPTRPAAASKAMTAADGAFDSASEDVAATIDTSSLLPGKHILFVVAQDANGQWGVPSAAFLTISGSKTFLPLLFVPPPILTWAQVNAPGFGEHPGPYTGQEAFDLTVFGDQLYLGMEGFACARIWRSRAGVAAPGQGDWEQVVSNGFDGTADCAAGPPSTDNDHIDSLEPFGGYLYASTAMQTTGKRGTQIWRSASGGAGTWVRVNEPGFGVHTNENFKDMIEFAGLLCGGTGNPGAEGIPSGAQVWCSDGLTPDPGHPGELLWTQRNSNGFGHAENLKIWSSAVHDAALYFGVEAREMDGAIWRTSDIGDQGAWEQVFAPVDMGLHASRVDVLQDFNGYLYVGMAVPGQGVRIYRSASGDRGTWKPVVGDGFGAVTTGRLISDASTALGNALYVAVLDEAQGAGIWRTADGSTWTRAAPYGFGDPSTFAAELIAFHGDLYAWTSNYAVGQGVWRGRLRAKP
jgi:hypothetical protein